MSNRPIYVLNSPLNDVSSSVKLLGDLGKPTKRGIKRCFNCGTYNGTRGLICKNKDCCTLFKETDCDCKTSLDAVRLITGNSRRVYSVKVKERGPHHRGFVQLPFQEKEINDQRVALCFVDSCQRLFNNSILKCHETKQNDNRHEYPNCPHIESALKSVHVARTFEIQKEVLDKLRFSEDIKRQLLKLFSETDGPLVQQVSKSVMAVKCQVSPKHPLGYLHFTLLSSKGKEAFDKYHCSCSQFKDHVCSKTTDNTKCIHYYACVWTFANCSSLPDELLPIFAPEISSQIPSNSISEVNMMTLLNDKSANFEGEQSKSQEQSKSVSVDEISYSKDQSGITNQDNNGETFIEIYSSNAMLDTNCNTNSLNKRPKLSEDFIDALESLPSISFVEWLSSVTERINQSLSNESLSKNYEILEFQIPESFFISLRNRINRGGEISGQSFTSSTVYSETEGMQMLFNIFSAHHLKEIFDTPQVSLCLVKTLVANKNSIVVFLQVDRQKQGADSNIFTIEWNSNVLPTSKFGILKLKFKIGKFN